MNNEINKIKKFRLDQSREKLDLSTIMLSKELFNDSIILSYLSMFYSVRLLLIGKDDDSDDHEKILDLFEKYYEPTGWTEINIIEILKEAKAFKDKIENEPGITIAQDEALRFNSDAVKVREQVLSILDKS